jgi:hypothetical protein
MDSDMAFSAAGGASRASMASCTVIEPALRKSSVKRHELAELERRLESDQHQVDRAGLDLHGGAGAIVTSVSGRMRAMPSEIVVWWNCTDAAAVSSRPSAPQARCRCW